MKDNNNNKCASNYNICVNDGMCTPTKINSPSVYIFSILIKTHVYKHDLYPLHVERKEEEKEAKDKKWRRKKKQTSCTSDMDAFVGETRR